VKPLIKHSFLQVGLSALAVVLALGAFAPAGRTVGVENAAASASSEGSSLTFTILHTFTSGIRDGAISVGGPVVTSAGDIFDTATHGGTANLAGVAFEFTHDGKFKIVHDFVGSPDGAGPGQPMVLNSDGSLTLTAVNGGRFGFGVIEAVKAGGPAVVLHSFDGNDGSGPLGVIGDGAGTLFGVAAIGGYKICGDFHGCGTVWSFAPATGSLRVLHKFHGPEGALPFSTLARDNAGDLFGTTEVGGSGTCPAVSGERGCGIVFEIDTSGMYHVIHTFVGSDGQYPLSLTGSPQGTLYGSTFKGGAIGLGVVFAVDSAGHITTLHTFSGGADGSYPDGLTVFHGKIFGFAAAGGASACKCGTVFELDPATKKLRTLHTFHNGGDGAYPSGTLAVDARGAVVGTTAQGGDLTKCLGNGCGTLFRIQP
jgi:uncharacterized repeat protein (TIGR03803 family)